MKNWTVLVFMVPDKRLEDAARQDVEEMEAAGIPDEINLAVHIDFENGPERFVFEDGKRKQLRGVPHDAIRPSLEAFLEWSRSQFQREPVRAIQDALILWGHGQGVGTKLSLPARFGHAATRNARSNRSPRVREERASRVPYQIVSTRSAHCVVPQRVMSAVAQEESAETRALDVMDVSEVLNVHATRIGKKLDILGFDACFMAGIEVAFQLQGAAELLVASQDFVPDEGWDYHRFLELIAVSGGGDAERVAKAIVGQVRNAGGLTNLTLMNLRNCPTLEKLATALTRHLDSNPGQKARVQRLFEKSAYLRVRQLIDVRNFCERLVDDFAPTGNPAEEEVSEAGWLTLQELEPGFVLKHEAEAEARKLRGVSVYYPYVHAGFKLPDDPSPAEMNVDIDDEKYDTLALVQDYGWRDLLRRLDPVAKRSVGKVESARGSACPETYAASSASR